jgi:thiosulfate/3-mercaptopyruvate sulfurtransferase
MVVLLSCAHVAVGSMVTTAQAGEVPIRFAEAGEIAEGMENAAVLDTRSFGEYLKGHVPGAVHMDDECLRGSVPGLPVQYCAAEQMAALFGEAGVSLEVPVVVYASKEDPLAASMAAYALARVGHSDITILAGGFGAWAANHEVSKAFPRFEPARFAPGEPTIGAITYEEFEESIGFDDVVFIDARPASHYRGDAPIWRANGHIPGAHSLDWKKLTYADNHHRLINKGKIKEMVDELDVSPYDDVVVYCGTGREATLLLVALSCELGWQSVKLYEGSWTEYSALQDAKIEVGKRKDPQTRVFQDGRVGISGQPTEDTFEAMAQRGVRTVVSCRTGGEMDRLDFNEEELLTDLGIEYVHIPMGGHDGYTPEQVDRFSQVMQEGGEGGVVLHCASGGRARMLWMAHLVEQEGLTPGQALDRGLQIGGKAWSFDRLLGGRLAYDTGGES